MQLGERFLQLFRNGQSQTGRILEDAQALVGELIEDRCRAQGSPATDPARRHAMGEAAVRRVEEVFDYRESARHFAALFTRLARGLAL